MIRNLCSLLLLISLLSVQKAQAQDDPQYRLEIGAGIGTMAYEGDFNGSIFKNMQPMAAVVGRYNIDPYKDLRLNIGFGKIKDLLTMWILISLTMPGSLTRLTIRW